MRGKLIVLEGIDGSGKTTQTRLLVKRLKKEGYPVVSIDFPQYQKTFFGPIIAKYLQGFFGKAGKVSPHFAALLYALDRYETKTKLERWLKQGKMIIANRYVPSQCHQAGKIRNRKKRKAFLQWVAQLEYGTLGIPKPDKIFLFHLPPTLAQGMVWKKGRRVYLGSKKMDIHEKDLQHLQQTQQTYLEMAKMESWTIIPCVKQGTMLPPEAIHATMWQKIRHVL